MKPENEFPILVDYINKLTDRRQNVTSIHLSVNTVIIGAISFWVKDSVSLQLWQKFGVLTLILAGIITCELWRRLLAQYKTLLDWWYGKLRNVEKSMAQSSKLFTEEYQELYNSPHKKDRIGLSSFESNLALFVEFSYMLFGFGLIASMFVS
jgi:hypothetical protein